MFPIDPRFYGALVGVILLAGFIAWWRRKR
jgi:hypothetical protein